MNAWMGEAIRRYFLGFAALFFEYRFLKKMFGTKYRHTFVWFYLGSFIYGFVNRTFVLAGTTLTNFIYLSLCGLVLNMLLWNPDLDKPEQVKADLKEFYERNKK